MQFPTSLRLLATSSLLLVTHLSPVTSTPTAVPGDGYPGPLVARYRDGSPDMCNGTYNWTALPMTEGTIQAADCAVLRQAFWDFDLWPRWCIDVWRGFFTMGTFNTCELRLMSYDEDHQTHVGHQNMGDLVDIAINEDVGPSGGVNGTHGWIDCYLGVDPWADDLEGPLYFEVAYRNVTGDTEANITFFYPA
ncbi:hypothetical protein F4778DRAFT_766175 [Xylariomycetidae sp. FL2044]|nr:hypothetical protein F4778DRAFT_766175 [Xylariomycetidae sp. FL2044]